MNPGMSALLSVSSAHVAYGKVEAVRSVSLDVGAVIASGTPETALRDPKVLTAYLGETA